MALPTLGTVGIVLAVVLGWILYYEQQLQQPQYWPPVDSSADAILVTGSHTGIGKATALTLARDGFTVFCGVRQVEAHGTALHATARDFGIPTERLRPVLLDVTKPEHVQAAVETIQAFLGPDRGLYGLFNNAGIAAVDSNGLSVEDVSLETHRHIMEVNYFGALSVTKAFLPLLRQRQGRIVFNTSIAGFFAAPFACFYTVTKFATEALADSLRREVAPLGVKVSVVRPGFTKSSILVHYTEGDFLAEGDAAAVAVSTDNVYAARLRKLRRRGVVEALQATSTRLVAQAVAHAMRAPRPRTRYTVGHLSWETRLLSWLPDAWLDALLAFVEMDLDHVTKEDLDKISSYAREEVEI